VIIAWGGGFMCDVMVGPAADQRDGSWPQLDG